MLTLDIKRLRETAKKENSCGCRARNKLAALERCGYKCVTCGSMDNLTCHHWTSAPNLHRRDQCSYNPNMLVTLCSDCHEKIHAGDKHG